MELRNFVETMSFRNRNGEFFCSICDWYLSGATFDDLFSHCDSKNHLQKLKERFPVPSNKLCTTSNPKTCSQTQAKVDLLGVDKIPQFVYLKHLSDSTKAKKQEKVQGNTNQTSTEKKPQTAGLNYANKQQNIQPQVIKTACANKKTEKEDNLAVPLLVSLTYTQMGGKNWICTLCNKTINNGFNFMTLLRNANTHYNSKAHLSKVSTIEEAANILSGSGNQSSGPFSGKQETDVFELFKHLGVKK